MNSSLFRKILLSSLALALILGVRATAQTTPIKIGVVYSYTGGSPTSGPVLDAALAAWLAQHKGMMGGRPVELIKRDDTGPKPDNARRLAQELVVNDKVDFLLGSTFTPNAVAINTVATQSKTPFCVVNAAGTAIMANAPYSTRLGVTMPQIAVPLAKWAATHGIKSVYNVLSDYQPGIDAGKAFSDSFTAAGGKMLGEVRVPIDNLVWDAYIQRVKDAKPDAVFIFVGSGPPAIAFFKAYHAAGLDKAGIKVLASGDALEEDALPQMGDEPAGVVSTLNYSMVHPSPLNREFVKAFEATNPPAGIQPDFFAVAAYDCMTAIDRAVEAQKGTLDPDKTIAAWNGAKWESPRGPIQLDPQNRDIIQNMYTRRVEKEGGTYVNVEFATTPSVKPDGQ